MHVYSGNYEGAYHYDVPLADVIDLVFTAKPNAISFEAANPRHARIVHIIHRNTDFPSRCGNIAFGSI